MAPVPLSPLRDLDLNRQHRPDKSKQNGTKPNDVIHPPSTFGYAPSAPPLSIDRPSTFLSPRGQATSLSPVSPVSGSEASSYGSYIGSHLYAQPVGWNTQDKGPARRTPTWTVGEEEMSISGRLASSGSSDGFRGNNYQQQQFQAQFSNQQQAQPTQRLTPAPAMHRQLSSRSNDGFLFPSEDLDSNIQHNSMFTPDATSRASSSQHQHPAPHPFGYPTSYQNEDAYPGTRKGSHEQHVGLTLESPWKSPGWKVQQRENARERSGSVVMASVEEVNEIPKVSHYLSWTVSVCRDADASGIAVPAAKSVLYDQEKIEHVAKDATNARRNAAFAFSFAERREEIASIRTSIYAHPGTTTSTAHNDRLPLTRNDDNTLHHLPALTDVSSSIAPASRISSAKFIRLAE